MAELEMSDEQEIQENAEFTSVAENRISGKSKERKFPCDKQIIAQRRIGEKIMVTSIPLERSNFTQTQQT